MKRLISTYIAGILFGAGLSISEMINPERVSDFLDISGDWDATLLFVMGGALVVATPAFAMVRRRKHPLFSDQFMLPVKKEIDPKLLAGATLFGVGWGISGFCPGPAIAALVTGMSGVIWFVLAMMAGQYLAIKLENRRSEFKGRV